jgi:imidazolonepropionase-like amidohydrolase
VNESLQERHVLVESERIAEVSDRPIVTTAAQTIDLNGRVLMPGLIDIHVHAYYPRVNPTVGNRLPMTFVAHRARKMLEDSLQRGFTSVRDTGGGDYGLHMAIESGLVKGPRLFYCGKAIGQTGGHADKRHPQEEDLCLCGSGYDGHFSVTVDGADNVRRTVREYLRRGAHFIKLMGSGGVSSMADPLYAPEYSEEEIRAAVDETERHGTYVTAHIHPDDAMRRAIELGVKCIEHGTLVSEQTAQLAAERGIPVVPTLSVIMMLSKYGKDLGFSTASLEKLAEIEPLALQGVERMHRAGVTLGFGTDLIGELERYQAVEFTIRREVLPPLDVLRSATSVNAAIMEQGSQLGKVEAKFLADLIVVDANPLEDVELFDERGTNVSLVMKGGQIFKNTLI